jgi:hypothetical protein
MLVTVDGFLGVAFLQGSRVVNGGNLFQAVQNCNLSGRWKLWSDATEL